MIPKKFSLCNIFQQLAIFCEILFLIVAICDMMEKNGKGNIYG